MRTFITPKIVEELMYLLSIPNPPAQEDRIRDYLKEQFLQLGFTAKKDKIGNLILHPKEKNKVQSGKRPLLLNAHMDSVVRGHAIPAERKGNKIFAEDINVGADDIAGVMEILAYIRYLKSKRIRYPNIEIVLTVQEEIGGNGARNLDTSLVRAREGVILDKGARVGTIVVGEATLARFHIAFKGRSSHAATPSKGVNAFGMMIEFFKGIKIGRINSKTVVNFSDVRGEGFANIIPRLIGLQGEIRTLNTQYIDRFVGQLNKQKREVERKYRGGETTITFGERGEGFLRDRSDPLLCRIQDTFDELKMQARCVTSFGKSDASRFAIHSIKTFNLGCGYFNPHSPEEYADISEMEKACKFLYAFCKNY